MEENDGLGMTCSSAESTNSRSGMAASFLRDEKMVETRDMIWLLEVRVLLRF